CQGRVGSRLHSTSASPAGLQVSHAAVPPARDASVNGREGDAAAGCGGGVQIRRRNAGDQIREAMVARKRGSNSRDLSAPAIRRRNRKPGAGESGVAEQQMSTAGSRGRRVQAMRSLSIVITAYNEENRIGRTLAYRAVK